MLVWVGMCAAIGCTTPEDRYRTLAFFFDGVPVPESMRPPPTPEELAPKLTKAQLHREQALEEWVIHDPDCDECHTSKETSLPYLDPPDLCWECHDEEDFVDEVLHGPFGAGACTQCHSPHKSKNEHLLVKAVPELCRSCHDDTTFPEMEEHQETEGDDCVDCHNPHAGPGAYMLDESAYAPPAARAWALAAPPEAAR